MNASAVILAGGKSSRMGFDKSLLQLGEKSMIEHISDRIRPMFKETLIVSNQNNKYGIPDVQEIFDIYVDKGPLGGIHAALSTASYPEVFVISCDMPFIKPLFIERLLAASPGFDVTVFRINGKYEPLCAIYNKSCLPLIEDRLKRDRCSVYQIYPYLRVNYLGEESVDNKMSAERIFFNMNTPQDYQLILASGKVG